MIKGVDCVGVGIGAVIVKGDNRLFLAQRGKKARNERGKWEFPGGALKFGENFEDTIMREIEEEFGFVVNPISQLETYNHYLPEENQHWVALCFECAVVKGEPKILEPDKCADFGWFSIEEAKKLNLTKTAVQRIKQLQQKYPNKF